MKSVVIVGGTRGLGAELAKELREQGVLVRVVGRKAERPDWKHDLNQKDQVESLLHRIRQLEPSHLWWVAGGGPYGRYGIKNWKDHEWAFQVSFLSAAQALHFVLQNPWKDLRQVVFVGSAIAEAQADPQA